MRGSGATETSRARRAIALWLSREYLLAFDNDAASRGWLARAERLLRDVAPGAEAGWLDLTRSEAVRDPGEAASFASAALDVALVTGDLDLELRALAQLGLAEVSLGETDRGLARLDEAMAAATSGEPATLETFADICCTLMLACERAGDSERPQQWSAVLDDFVRAHDHVTLLAFCRTCCADVYAANGRIDSAEAELELAVRELTASGQRSRCIPPSARLAEIRVLQGRFDEAEQLLDGLEAEPEALRARVAVRIARGEPAAASALLTRGSTSSGGRTCSPRRSSRSSSRRGCSRAISTVRRRRPPRSRRSPRSEGASASRRSRRRPAAESPSPKGARTRPSSCSRR